VPPAKLELSYSNEVTITPCENLHWKEDVSGLTISAPQDVDFWETEHFGWPTIWHN
jgi:hypothetical protein